MKYQVRADKNYSQKDKQDFSETLTKIYETNNPETQVNIQKRCINQKIYTQNNIE